MAKIIELDNWQGQQPHKKGDLSKYDYFFTEGTFLSDPTNAYAQPPNPDSVIATMLKKLSIKDPLRALTGLFWAPTDNSAPTLGANSQQGSWSPDSVIKPNLIEFHKQWGAGTGQKYAGDPNAIVNLIRDYASEVKNASSHRFTNFVNASSDYEIFIFGIYSVLQKYIKIKKIGETGFTSPKTVMGYSLEPDNFNQTRSVDPELLTNLGLVEDFALYFDVGGSIEIADVSAAIFLWNLTMKSINPAWSADSTPDTFLRFLWFHMVNPELYPLDDKNTLQKIGSKSFGKEYDITGKTNIYTNKTTHGGLNYRYVLDGSSPGGGSLVYNRLTGVRLSGGDGTYTYIEDRGFKPSQDSKDDEFFVMVPKTRANGWQIFEGTGLGPNTKSIGAWLPDRLGAKWQTAKASEMKVYFRGGPVAISGVWRAYLGLSTLPGAGGQADVYPKTDTWWKFSYDASVNVLIITYLPDAPWILEEEDELDRLRSYEDTNFRIASAATINVPVEQGKGLGNILNIPKAENYIMFSSRYNNRDSGCEDVGAEQNERSLPFFYMPDGPEMVFSKKSIPSTNYFGCKNNTSNDVPQVKRALVYPNLLFNHFNSLKSSLACEDGATKCIPHFINIQMPIKKGGDPLLLSPDQKILGAQWQGGAHNEYLASLYYMSNIAVSEARQDCAGTNFGYYNERHDYDTYTRASKTYSNKSQTIKEKIRSIELDPRIENTGAPRYLSALEVWNTTYQTPAPGHQSLGGTIIDEVNPDCAGGTVDHILPGFAMYAKLYGDYLAADLQADYDPPVNLDQAGASAAKKMFILLIEKDLLSHARNYEQILKGELAKYFVAGYKISKYRIVTKPGDYTEELVQTFYIPTPSSEPIDMLSYFDTQVKFNKMYRYSIEAVIAVVGTKYVFDTTRKPYYPKSMYIKQHKASAQWKVTPSFPTISYRKWVGPFFGTLPPDVTMAPDLAYSKWATLKFSVRSQPSVKLLSVPLVSDSSNTLGSSTYGIFLAQDPQPVMTPTPYRFVNDKMMFMFERVQGFSATPYYPFDAGIGAWTPPEHMKSIWQQKTTKVKVKNKFEDETIEQEEMIAYELYRTTTKPEVLSDIIGTPSAPIKPYATISSRAFPTIPEPVDKNGDKVYDSWGDMFIDDLKPNTVYYYTVRASNQISSAKPWVWADPYVFKIEIIDDGSTLFPSIETIPLNIEKKLKDNITFRKKIKIAPAFLQAAPNKEKKDLGFTEESVFNRAFQDDIDLPAFKFRITSTKTGRKMDLNIIFTSEVKTSGPLPDDSELLLSWKKQNFLLKILFIIGKMKLEENYVQFFKQQWRYYFRRYFNR